MRKLDLDTLKTVSGGTSKHEPKSDKGGHGKSKGKDKS